MFGAMSRAAGRWRAVRISGFERRRMAAIRAEPDKEYEAATNQTQRKSAQTNYPEIPGLDVLCFVRQCGFDLLRRLET